MPEIDGSVHDLCLPRTHSLAEFVFVIYVLLTCLCSYFT